VDAQQTSGSQVLNPAGGKLGPLFGILLAGSGSPFFRKVFLNVANDPKFWQTYNARRRALEQKEAA
jgi:hypothetical protein